MEFLADGQVYRTCQMDVFKQFHVARRLAPLLGSFGDALVEIKGAFQDGPDGKRVVVGDPVDLAVRMFGPVSEALSRLTDADSEYVLKECLAAAERKTGDNHWSRVRAANGALMYNDIPLPTVLRIAAMVVWENLGNFFPIAAQALPPSAPQEKS